MKPCNDEDGAFEALVAGVATTLPGLLAWLAYLQELDGAFETEWMITNAFYADPHQEFRCRPQECGGTGMSNVIKLFAFKGTQSPKHGHHS